MVKMHKWIRIPILLLPLALRAGVNETLPSWHWSYRIIDELRLRGWFDSLSAMQMPYTRGDAAAALLALKNREAAGKFKPGPDDKKLLLRMNREFRPEMEALEAGAGRSEIPRAGVRLLETLAGGTGTDPRAKGVFRSKVFVPLGTHAGVYNGMSFDQVLLDDPLFMGKRWRGMALIAEQAYLVLDWKKARVKAGRDFLRWGPGRSGTLLFSDVARPMDQVSACFSVGPFRYSFTTAMLDSWWPQTAVTDSLGAARIRRWVSAHRVEARLFGNRVQCAVSEAVLFGGLHRGMDWNYLNPFLSYHAEQANDVDAANTLGTLDLAAWPLPGTEVYGSLLIDDIQVEKTGPGDLEPAEIGWIAGARLGGPVLPSTVSLFLEYARVANRTYKTRNPWETFLHRNKPLGHPLGNDFDRFEAGLSKWFSGSFHARVTWTRIRKGEGSLHAPFDEPWLSRTVEQGYSEPFPFGVVETTNAWAFSLLFLPTARTGFEAEIRAPQAGNSGHVTGAKKSSTEWRLGVWVDADVFMLGKR